MRTTARRFHPGEDLLDVLVAWSNANEFRAPIVLTCVGSLSTASLRMAGAKRTDVLAGTFEIVSLVGTLAEDGAHLHLAVSDEAGAMTGGHLMSGSIVRTTAEVVIGELGDIVFRREIDPATSWDELVVEPRTN